MITLGCVTIFVGAIFALAQTDMKRLLAYSTISQLGYIITGLGLGTNLGIAAGLFYCLSHGLFKGTLFLCAGAVQHSTGTRDMPGFRERFCWQPHHFWRSRPVHPRGCLRGRLSSPPAGNSARNC